MKKSSVYRMRRFLYFRILCYVLERWIRTQHQILLKDSSQYRTSDTIDRKPMEFVWNIFPGSTTLELVREVQKFMSKMANQNNSKDELSSCRCSMTSCGDIKTMKRNVLPTPHLWLYLQKDFQQDIGHASDLDQKQSGILINTVAELIMIKLGESGHPVFRATGPLSRGTLKSKGGGKLSIHFCADGDTIETVFRTIISVNQLSIYGAVSDLCEEYSSCRTRTGRPCVAEQSDPLFAPADLLIMTDTLDWSSYTRKFIAKKYKEEVEKLPRPDQVLKICIDAGFLKTVEVGQYSWQRTLKSSHNSQNQWHVVSIFCHETKPQLTRKVGFEGTPKFDPC